MNTSPHEGGPDHGVDTLYRRLARLDPSEPTPATRDAVMARAQQLANSRAAAAARQSRRSVPFRWGHTAAVGTLAASILAALVIVPRYLLPDGSSGPTTQGHPAIASAADQARQAAPPATSAADNFAQSGPASPEPTAPRAASRPSPPVAAAAPAAKSATAGSPAAQEAAPAAAFGNAQRALQQANASRSAVTGRLAESPVPPEQRLRQAAQAGDTGEIAALAPQLTDLNGRDEQGRTAVMIATQHRQTAAVAALLSLGADPNVADVNGLTPLQAAREAGASRIVAALERYGAH
jgi:hypothetical protein